MYVGCRGDVLCVCWCLCTKMRVLNQSFVTLSLLLQLYTCLPTWWMSSVSVSATQTTFLLSTWLATEERWDTNARTYVVYSCEDVIDLTHSLAPNYNHHKLCLKHVVRPHLKAVLLDVLNDNTWSVEIDVIEAEVRWAVKIVRTAQRHSCCTHEKWGKLLFEELNLCTPGQSLHKVDMLVILSVS